MQVFAIRRRIAMPLNGEEAGDGHADNANFFAPKVASQPHCKIPDIIIGPCATKPAPHHCAHEGRHP
jgi:hypothetical protein